MHYYSIPCVCCLPLSVADTDGMVKVLSDSKTDRILGVHIVGSVSLTCLNTDLQNICRSTPGSVV